LQVYINTNNHTQNTTSHVLYVTVNIYIHTIVIDALTGMFHIEFNTWHFFFGSFTKLGKATIASSCLSVCRSDCPHVTTQLQLDIFSWNLMYEHFFKSFIKISQK